jgi:hypothetical protein
MAVRGKAPFVADAPVLRRGRRRGGVCEVAVVVIGEGDGRTAA